VDEEFVVRSFARSDVPFTGDGPVEDETDEKDETVQHTGIHIASITYAFLYVCTPDTCMCRLNGTWELAFCV